MSLTLFGHEESTTSTSGIIELAADLERAAEDSPVRELRPVPDQDRQRMARQSLDGFSSYLTGVGIAERTRAVYVRIVTRFVIFAADEGFSAKDADALELHAYTETLLNTSATRRQHRSALRHWFESTGRTDAPIRAIRVPPKKRGTSRALEPDEASKLARVAVDIDHPGGSMCCLGCISDSAAKRYRMPGGATSTPHSSGAHSWANSRSKRHCRCIQ